MSNSDSFINEVSEEVRRDRLFAILRRWAWLAVLIILVLVGGAAWNEYRQAQDEARAQAFGNAILTALDVTEPEARAEALAAIATESPEEEAIVSFLLAGEAAEADDPVAAAARLRALAETADIAPRYRDLAELKAHLLDPQDSAEALAMLDRLARPGAPYRALAIEQQAYVRFAEGEIDAGIELLRQLEIDASATPGLQQRASQLIVALEAGSSLADAGTGTSQDAATTGNAGAGAPAPQTDATDEGAGPQTEDTGTEPTDGAETGAEAPAVPADQ